MSQIVNYAFVETLYNDKRDLLGTFEPFILKAVADINKSCSSEEITNHLEKVLNLIIPINTVTSIVESLRSKNYLSVNGTIKDKILIDLSEKGNERIDNYIEEEEVVRRNLNKFYKEFLEFLKKNDSKTKLDYEYIRKELPNLIASRITNYIKIIQEDKKIEEEKLSDLEKNIFKFILEVKESEQNLFDTLNSIIRGSIVWNEIQKNTDLDKQNKELKINLVLDTNYLISLLGMDHPSISKAANQLFKLINSFEKIQLQVSNLTLEELTRLLEGYKDKQYNYSRNISVNHIYSFMKQKGFDNLKIDEFKSNLSKELKERNIEIIEIENIKDSDKIYQSIYNERRTDYGSNDVIKARVFHDASIIKYIQTSRKNSWITEFDKCEYSFLTSSYSLNEMCKKLERKNGSIHETILDIKLTNILWLRNPLNDCGLTIHNIISYHSKELLIDNQIWLKFQNRVKDLLDVGKISEEDYARIISNNQYTIDLLNNENQNKDIDESIFKIRDRLNGEIEDLHNQIKAQKEEIQKQKSEKEKFVTNIIELQDENKKKEQLLRNNNFDYKVQELHNQRMEKLKIIEDIREVDEDKLLKYKSTWHYRWRSWFFDANELELNYIESLNNNIIRKYESEIKQIDNELTELYNSNPTNKKIVYCENKNAEYYNNLGLEKYYFYTAQNSKDVFQKYIHSQNCIGLRDRDYLGDKEIGKLKEKYPNYRILNLYSFENYLYHPENIAEYFSSNPNKKFDKVRYTTEIKKLNERTRINDSTIIESSRKTYEELKPQYNIENKEERSNIYKDLHSDEFDSLYKYFDIKKHKKDFKYLKEILASIRKPEKELTSTNWFKEKIRKILED